MRWPRWRKPEPEPPDDDHDFLRRIGWIDDDGVPIPSPERAKPDNTLVELPPCAPFPSHEHGRDCAIGACFACCLNSTAALRHTLFPGHCDGLDRPFTDTTRWNIFPTKETTMTEHLADGQPAPGSAWRSPSGATLLYAPIGNDDTDPWFSTEPNGSYGGWLGRDEVDTATLTPLVAADPTVAGTDAELAGLVRDVRDAKAPGYTVQVDGVKIAKCDTRGLTNEERASYERGLREGRLDNSVVRAEVVGSAEWLRDLADRVRDSTDYTDAPGSAEDAMVAALRHAANLAEHDEQKRARDTRDRERVEKIVRERYEAIGTAWPVYWDAMDSEYRTAMVDYALELYRAGRDDREEQNRG